MSRKKSPREYVVNGSRYPAAIYYLSDSCSETKKQTSVVIDVGDVFLLPYDANKLSINLRDAACREILKNLEVYDSSRLRNDRSTIITEEGTITYGQNKKSLDDRDWMWKSRSDKTDHKPRKFFVANASDEEIVVRQQRDGISLSTHSYVSVLPGEVNTLAYDGIVITVPLYHTRLEISRDAIKPRTSIIVLSHEKVKTTGKLYGEDIEDKKWIVDGRNYKPPSDNENLQ